MREILFRWKRQYGTWVYGSLLVYEDGSTDIATPCGRDMLDKYHVDKETVSQCTGLKDKHGTKIFDGDILELDEDLELKQFYDLIIIKITNIGVQYLTKEEQNWLWCIDNEQYFSSYKVVGNIFDNPELIK